MKSSLGRSLLFLGLFVLAMTIPGIWFLISLNGLFNGEVYHEKDLIIYFEETQNEIYEVKKFVTSRQQTGLDFIIEFEGKEISIFHVWSENDHDSNWGLSFNDSKTDSLLAKINWTQQDLLALRKLLNVAGCISVETGEALTVGWKRSGLGMYSFNLFDKHLTATQVETYESMCTHRFYRKNIMFEYGGGAIGPQCFPKYLEAINE